MPLIKISKYRRNIDLEDYGFFGGLLKLIITLGALLSLAILFMTLIRFCKGDSNSEKFTTINLLNPEGELYIPQKASKERILIRLEGGTSIEGKYASPNGIFMIFSTPINKTIELCGKSNPSWGEDISSWVNVESNDLTTSEKVLFPIELFGTNSENIKCKIIGDLIFPQRTLNNKFDNISKSVYQEVNIHIISDASFKQILSEIKKYDVSI